MENFARLRTAHLFWLLPAAKCKLFPFTSMSTLANNGAQAEKPDGQAGSLPCEEAQIRLRLKDWCRVIRGPGELRSGLRRGRTTRAERLLGHL